MTRTRLAWAVSSSEHAPPARARVCRGHLDWRSHTFADGVRSLTLVRPLDVGLAGRLWSRISELIERGGRRLIVDASTIEPTGEQAALLAAAFVGRPASYQAVVVAPPASTLGELLPRSVGVTGSLSEARHQLDGAIERPRAARLRTELGSDMPQAERHALAIRQAQRWADRAAREGDFEHALSWLTTIEQIGGGLPQALQRRRDAWVAAWAAQTAHPRSERPSDER